MKSAEFCYWLQGFFELSHLTAGIYAPVAEGSAGKPSATLFLQKAHYQCIQNHIDLVKTYEGEKVLPFVHWLEGCIAGYLVSSAASDYDSHAGHAQAVDITNEIQTRLGNIFVHEIDPSYGKDKQDAMNAAHSGSRPPRRPGLIHDSDRRLRC